MISTVRSQNYDKSTSSDHTTAGAFEYGWYGWSKWVPAYKDTWNLIMRFSHHENGGDADWWGDRTLNVWAGPGYLHFTTYNYCYNGCDDWNYVQNIGYGNQLEEWFFIYFAYSHSAQQARGYARFRNGAEQELVFNTRHLLPDTVNLKQSKDKWYPAFNGFMNDFNIVYGPGAFLQGSISYRTIMYRDNPQSVQVISTSRNVLLQVEQKENIVLHENETQFSNFMEDPAYASFVEQQQQEIELENNEIQGQTGVSNK